MTDTRKNAADLILEAIGAGVLRKAVFSKPASSEELKTECSPVKLGDKVMLRRISLMKDGKAIQKNIATDDIESLCEIALAHSQINILTTLGDAEFKCSKSGKELLSGDRKIRNAISEGVEQTTERKITFFRATKAFLSSLVSATKTAEYTIKNSISSDRSADSLNTLKIFIRIFRVKANC